MPKMADDKVYNNEYHFLFEVRDGKILAAREYICTAQSWRFWAR